MDKIGGVSEQWEGKRATLCAPLATGRLLQRRTDNVSTIAKTIEMLEFGGGILIGCFLTGPPVHQAGNTNKITEKTVRNRRVPLFLATQARELCDLLIGNSIGLTFGLCSTV